MKLNPFNKKQKQAKPDVPSAEIVMESHSAATPHSSPTRSPADDLVGLEKLAEWKQTLKRLEADYRRGQAALVAARRQVSGVDPLPEPDLTWHVRRELLVAAGDADTLATFDQAHAADLAAELTARQNALQGAAEAQAKVKALTEYLTGIAGQMAALANDAMYRDEMKRLFKPSAERMLVAAQAFARAHREMIAMESALKGICRMHQSYVDGSRITPYDCILIERKGREEWLSSLIDGLDYDDLYDLNHGYDRYDNEVAQPIHDRLEQFGLDTSWVSVFHPGSEANPRQIYAVDPNPPKSKQQYVIPVY
ncbi:MULTISPECIES: hypothetical protein [unclassified Lysobacter]|uniref:hypothetical protein n=1 Tax=unclassified Lysobacter TaxID=2635362 RepID=UPI001BEB9AF7|nr:MULTISPECIES: hypothetical protein [unclassified Lysobacter]MBT2748285.1 hypothetical protein [Lysobacter sp. ISL-42]MBT2749948.1 hypothetical protein [Lysobacter sp. ISL-50]MBT2781276.1 hypothetical protein [Lysobacter sp. ISL-52]